MLEHRRSTVVRDRSEATWPEDTALARQAKFLEASLSSIPDCVYAFDRRRRFAYVNTAMLTLFGLSADEMLGKTFAELDYPADLAGLLDRQIDRIFQDGTTIRDEVFFRSPTGHAGHFSYIWGPVRDEAGSVQLVVGVSRDTSERRALEEALRDSETRLRAASELVGLGIYSWDPVTGALEWDERMRAMWGLPPDAAVDVSVFEAGIHPEDLIRVQRAIAACVDPSGSGRYEIEYRVIGRDDGVVRNIATSGRTTFVHGRATAFIGAAIDVSARRAAEAAIRSSEDQFRSFAAHSSNLIWIGDPRADTIVYRSAAYERIWGVQDGGAPIGIADWLADVHPDDRTQVERALASVKAGAVTRFAYRIIRPVDGRIRWLRDTSFPIPDGDGAIRRIGGITEDLTREEVRQVYVVSAKAGEARSLGALVRSLGYNAQTFDSARAFLDVAAVLAPGCVIVDLRHRRADGLSIPRELSARSIPLPTIALDAPGTDAAAAVAAMKNGAVDHLIADEPASFRATLATALLECQCAAPPPPAHDESATARIARLTPREREVLVGLVNGGTNKTIGRTLGISPRTVELHRAQLMKRLDAASLTGLIQIALAAGVMPTADGARDQNFACS